MGRNSLCVKGSLSVGVGRGLVAAAIIVGLFWAGIVVSYAGAGWKRLPTDEEIGEAASTALTGVSAEDWTTLKRRDPNQPVQNPLWVNEVLLVWIEPNPNYPPLRS